MADDLETLAHGDHGCMFFSSPEHQTGITARFLDLGLRRDERCVFVGDHDEVERMRESLRQAGLSVAQEEEKKRLILTSERDYLEDGHWQTEKMLGFLQAAYDSAMADGHTALRCAGDVSWQVGPEQDYREVVYYETLLDVFFIGKKLVGLCEYPREKCPPDTLAGILNTHKIAALDSQVCSNVHYVRPDLLLEKNPQERQAKRVQWMTSQLLRIKDAEAGREKALEDALQANFKLTQMAKVRDAFGAFVTPQVANHVLSTPREEWNRGAKRTVTALFMDVRNFTPFARAYPPQAVVETLNALFQRIAQPIQARGGMLNKFLGDGLMAVFGAPVDLPDHRRAAVQAALEARDAVAALAGERRAQSLPPLEVGFGLNTGEVVAGCLGTAERTEYTVIGHAVNVAARLEHLAKAGQILIGAETREGLGDEFPIARLGKKRLKGMADALEVFELAAAPKPKSRRRPRYR